MVGEENYRRHTRIREEIPVRWRDEHSGRQGEGMIQDISVSGVLLEMKTFFTLERNSVICLSAVKEEDELAIPERSRLVWIKPLKTEVGVHMAGLEFIKPSDSVVAKIAQRVENWFSRIAGAANVNILENYFKSRK